MSLKLDDGEQERIDQVRRFERWYEFHLRKSQRAAAGEDLTVADVRVLQELAFSASATGTWVAFRLDLDEGYLCRILKKLEACRFVASCASEGDRRMREWHLTASGRKLAASIESERRDRIRMALHDLAPEQQRRLVVAMGVVERILSTYQMRRFLERP